MRGYTFRFMNGYTKSGKPSVITRKVRAESLAEAEKKLKKRYPKAKFISRK